MTDPATGDGAPTPPNHGKPETVRLEHRSDWPEKLVFSVLASMLCAAVMNLMTIKTTVVHVLAALVMLFGQAEYTVTRKLRVDHISPGRAASPITRPAAPTHLDPVQPEADR